MIYTGLDFVKSADTDKTNLDNFYQPDDKGAPGLYRYDLEDIANEYDIPFLGTYGANTFKKKSSNIEYVKEVQVYRSEIIDEDTLEVYVIPNANNWPSTKAGLESYKVGSVSGSAYEGFDTIQLDTPVKITGSTYGVVIKYSDTFVTASPTSRKGLVDSCVSPNGTDWAYLDQDYYGNPLPEPDACNIRTFTDSKIVTVSSLKNRLYTGSVFKPEPIVKLGSTKLIKDQDYTLSYSNNKKTGKASVKVIGKGSAKGYFSKIVYFKIIPKKAGVSKLTRGTKKLTVYIKSQKTAGVSGYQVAYKRSGGSYKYVRSTGTIKTIKYLKSKKRYYVKVRAYKTIDNKRCYGSWSSAKSTIVK